MGEPTFASGTTPRRGDTRLFLLSKRLQAIQGFANAPLAANDAKRNNTVRILRKKIVKALQGI